MKREEARAFIDDILAVYKKHGKVIAPDSEGQISIMPLVTAKEQDYHVSKLIHADWQDDKGNWQYFIDIEQGWSI